jgi:hypothetical protein
MGKKGRWNNGACSFFVFCIMANLFDAKPYTTCDYLCSVKGFKTGSEANSAQFNRYAVITFCTQLPLLYTVIFAPYMTI